MLFFLHIFFHPLLFVDVTYRYTPNKKNLPKVEYLRPQMIYVCDKICTWPCTHSVILGLWMRTNRVVRMSDSLCQSRNCPGFDPGILQHSEVWGAADETVLYKVHWKQSPFLKDYVEDGRGGDTSKKYSHKINNNLTVINCRYIIFGSFSKIDILPCLQVPS